MKCPGCQFENREGAKFCGKCGHKFEITCLECGTKNQPENVFCDECGSNLSLPIEKASKELSFNENLKKIQKYLPKGLTEKILSQRDHLEGERKQVTVMFCDMEGFTPLSELLDIEEIYMIMDQVYEILIHKVHYYEGTVNEMTGDGIMALFGAPIALEDAPQRAIRSSLAIHREMAKFSDKLTRQKKVIPPVKMRIGIHTGPVVVGTVGNDLRVEFKAVGDTVNLASRMEGQAQPGTTYITEDTFKLTEGLFRFEALGEHHIKGKEGAVKAFRVIAPRTIRTRFDVSAEKGLTPFIGRQRALELLLDGFERSKSGKGQAFSIVSEAGVGKTRLLYEFRKAVSDEDVTFQEGRCLSYSKGVVYHPLIDIVKSNFNILEGDGDFEIREKLKQGLCILGADEASTLPYLLELLSVKESGVDKISLSPDARKDLTIEAIKRIILKASQIRTLVIAVEDLHWIDKSSEDTLKALLDSIAGEKLFLIFTYRPEFLQTWAGKSYHSQVNLNRLSRRESLAMVINLLGNENIKIDLEELILKKTDGIPFFIEEFIKSLKDLKIIEITDGRYHLAKDLQELTIPSTIQDVIMARVDALPEAAKEVLQTGSVIEREFSYELIRHVSGLIEQELLPQLSAIKKSELLFERGVYPESIYIFRHVLTQEVVYDSILSRKKKELHNKIGQSIEQVYRDNLPDYYGSLIKHFINSENYEKGADYCKLLSKLAMKTASINEAIACGIKQVTCLEKLPKTEDVVKKIINARTILGLHYMQLNYHVESKKAVEPIIDLAIEFGNKKRISQIYIILGTYNYLVKEDFPKALKYLKDSLIISEEIKDVVCESLAAYWLGFGLAFNCEYENALYHLEKALHFQQFANIKWAESMTKTVIGYFIYFFQGKFNLVHQMNDEALRITEKSGDLYSKSMAYSAVGLSCYCKGLFEEATQHYIKGAELCEKINHFYSNALTHFNLGETFYKLREYQKSKEHYGRAINLLEQNRSFPFWVKLFKVGLARAKTLNNEKDFDLESLYGYAHDNKVNLYDGWISRYIGEILLQMDDNLLPDAEYWLNKALNADRKNGVMFHLGNDYTCHAALSKRKGDHTKAKESLSKAVEIFKECAADGWVQKYEKELAELS